MGRMKAVGRASVTAAVLIAACAPSARAIFLDEAQNFTLRARLYSQAAVRIEDSKTDTAPTTKAGQLVQHRNFFNPELEAKLTSYTSWMHGSFLDFMAPDDFSLRTAAWVFYDGIYDYGSQQFDRAQGKINTGYPNPVRKTAFQVEGSSFKPAGKTLKQIIPDAQELNPRDIFGHDQRVNELYLNYTKGPVFIRFGKQAISWGESDTIALLDQNNPFAINFGPPGLFIDLDEARIPLWTLRTSLNLFDTLGPLSSGFVESYWVPGFIDNNTGWMPMLTASPYSPPQPDAQAKVPSLLPAQFVLYDRVPHKRMQSSRYGFRTQAVVDREYTVSAWFYTTFPSAPVPISHGLTPTRCTQAAPCFFTTELDHHNLTSVFGAATTFFVEPVDSIIRAELEYFDNESGFIPEKNLGVNKETATNPLKVLTNCSGEKCSIPKADILRWELGLDRFFFARFLNPTNSFTFVSAIVGSWNLSETSVKDFRMNGQTKRGKTGNSPDDYVQMQKVEAFGQIALRTDYMHGRLTPGIVFIQNLRGTYAINPALTYRWTDYLLFDVGLVHIGGMFQQVGFYNDRDQVSTRMTLQLN